MFSKSAANILSLLNFLSWNASGYITLRIIVHAHSVAYTIPTLSIQQFLVQSHKVFHIHPTSHG